jgi:uncharacterized secreted protein with C-terminal beta-propeller domain
VYLILSPDAVPKLFRISRVATRWLWIWTFNREETNDVEIFDSNKIIR